MTFLQRQTGDHHNYPRLVELGLIERAPDQRIAVAWDTITAEMKLAA
jgi:hypothetical protein